MSESGSSILGEIQVEPKIKSTAKGSSGVEDTLAMVTQVGGLDGDGSQAQEGQNHSQMRRLMAKRVMSTDR